MAKQMKEDEKLTTTLHSPDPTINPSIGLGISNTKDDSELELSLPKTRKVPARPKPVQPKSTKATKSTLEADQIYHRPISGGIALGEPVQVDAKITDDEIESEIDEE